MNETEALLRLIIEYGGDTGNFQYSDQNVIYCIHPIIFRFHYMITIRSSHDIYFFSARKNKNKKTPIDVASQQNAMVLREARGKRPSLRF